LDNIAFYQRCGFRMDAVKRGYFDYVQPEVTEFDIALRDMIVFAYEPPPMAAASGDLEPVDPARLEGVDLLLIPGSTRDGSRNHAVLRAVSALAPRSVIYDGLARLPQFDPDADPTADEEVAALRALLGSADVVVISTPEYAGTLPGSMKNLLDWTVGTADLYQKPVAWINVAPAGRGRGAGSDLARVLGYVDARILTPGGLQLPLDPAAVGAQGEIVDQDYLARLLRGIVAIAESYRQTRSRR
jgi:NAD(P)H-dependent FMN reductase